MNDLSTPGPIEGAPWPEWRGNNARRCIAHKKNGEQCRRHARCGATVCDFHGGKAPQVKAKARQRLDEAADRMARELLGIATSAESESVRLAAVKDALDRAGLGAKQALELSTKPLEPWEEVLQGVVFNGIGRGKDDQDSPRYGTLPDQSPEICVLAEFDFTEAELVAEPSGEDGPERAALSAANEMRALGRAVLPTAGFASFTAPAALPPLSVSYEDAAAIMRAAQARTSPGHRKRRVRRTR